MTVDQFEGQWDQLKGQVKAKWGKLTSDDLQVVRGKKDQLVGRLQERYGYSRDRAEREVGSFLKSCNCSEEGTPKQK